MKAFDRKSAKAKRHMRIRKRITGTPERPRLVVCRSLTNIQAQIVDLLRDLQSRYGLAYLFISHDLKVVRAMSNYLLVMKDGVVVEQGSAERIFSNPDTEYTRALIAAAFALEATA